MLHVAHAGDVIWRQTPGFVEGVTATEDFSSFIAQDRRLLRTRFGVFTPQARGMSRLFDLAGRHRMVSECAHMSRYFRSLHFRIVDASAASLCCAGLHLNI